MVHEPNWSTGRCVVCVVVPWPCFAEQVRLEAIHVDAPRTLRGYMEGLAMAHPKLQGQLLGWLKTP